MDFSAYALLDEFTIYDAAFLLCEHEPLSPGVIPTNDPHEVIRHKAATIAEQMVRDVKSGKLQASKRDIGEDWRLAGTPQWIVTRQALKDWADAKGIKPLFLFPESPPISATALPQQFDKASPVYPPELDIALQAWREVSASNGKGKPKARIKTWLNDNTSLTTEAKERIAIVANWDKTGGATRTG